MMERTNGLNDKARSLMRYLGGHMNMPWRTKGEGRRKASNEVTRRETRVKLRQLEWLVLAMVGAALGSLQIIRYVLLSPTAEFTALQAVMDWLFSMVVITFLVHFCFVEIGKIHDELYSKREEANKARKRMQHILDKTQDAIFTTDELGNFTYGNQSACVLTGRPAEELLGLNLQDVVSSGYRSFIAKQMSEFKELGGRHLYLDLVHHTRGTVPIELSLMPIQEPDGDHSGFQGIARDITEHREVENAHREKERYLQAIARVGQIMLSADAEVPYAMILEILAQASDSEQAFLLLRDRFLHPGAARNAALESPGPDGSRPEPGPNLLVSVRRNGEGYHHVNGDGEVELMIHSVPDAGGLPAALNSNWAADSYHVDNSKLVLPVMARTGFAGIMGFNKGRGSGGWRPVEINLLATAAAMVSQSIERSRTNAQLARHFISLAETICKAMFAIDPYTAGHQQRLAIFACSVGEKMGLGAESLEWLRFGAMVHDIGKAAIPASILSKPGALTDEEWGLLRSHVRRGYEMLQGMNLPDSVIDMILKHHERLDGSGYPQGIGEDKLSLEVRILSVCDVVEAMSSHRPYRPSRSKEEIVAELNKGRGIKYDAEITGLMLNMIEENELALFGQREPAGALARNR